MGRRVASTAPADRCFSAHAEDVSSNPAVRVGQVFLGYHDFSAGTLSPSQPGLALTGRVEARLLYDLYSVYGGVKLLQKQKQTSITSVCGATARGFAIDPMQMTSSTPL